MKLANIVLESGTNMRRESSRKYKNDRLSQFLMLDLLQVKFSLAYKSIFLFMLIF